MNSSNNYIFEAFIISFAIFWGCTEIEMKVEVNIPQTVSCEEPKHDKEE